MSFIANLWESVFTPGTTPTLLIATNVTFASLQVLLLALLYATYSIHFAILSVLCGGLWYSINWFAVELQAAQRAEEEAERLRKRKAAEKDGGRGEGGDADDEGEDTEVETGTGKGMGDSMISEGGLDQGVGGLEKEKREKIAKMAVQDPVVGSAAEASGVQTDAGRETRQRQAQQVKKGDLSSSEFSTDSEWEKVSEEGR